jgi:hypothetical protein
VHLGSTGFDGSDKASTNPDTLRAPGKIGGKAPSIEDSTSTNNIDGLAGERGSTAFNSVNGGRDEDARRNVASMPSSLAGLSADEVDTDLKGFERVFGVANHIHNEDAGFMELIDGPLWGNADGGDEEGGTLFDNDLDQFRKLPLGVIGL